MSAYTEEFLVDKLNKLVNTQESIQTLSEWIKFHKKKCRQSVDIWDRELFNAPRERKLVFLFLANEIMQTSRKKGGEFIQEYARVLPRAVLHVQRECDKDEKKSVSRLLNIWRERRVFPADFLENINKSLLGMGPSAEQLTAHVPAELDVPPASPQNKNDPVAVLMREMTGREVEISLADEKVQAIRPQLMSGEAMVTCLNQGEVTELAIELDEAITILNGFQKSLGEDLKTRTKLIDALKAYINTQEQQKEIVQKKIQDCKQELTVTEALKEQLKQLYEKLPPGSSDGEGAVVDPRGNLQQKRDSTYDISSPEKRARTTQQKSLLPSPNTARLIPSASPITGATPAINTLPITNTIIANQSYFTPTDNMNNHNNLYNSPTTPNLNNLNNLHISSPVDNSVNNIHYNHNYNQNYDDISNINNLNHMNNYNNYGNINNNQQDMGYNNNEYQNDYNADPYAQMSNLNQYGYLKPVQ